MNDTTVSAEPSQADAEKARLEAFGITRSFCLACLLAAGRDDLDASVRRRMPVLVGPSGATEDLFSAELHQGSLIEPAGVELVARAGGDQRLVTLNGRPWSLLSAPPCTRNLTTLVAWIEQRYDDERDGPEFTALWRVLCHGEVLSYLAAVLAERRFDRIWSGYASRAVAQGLLRYSAARMFSLCDAAVADMVELSRLSRSGYDCLPDVLVRFIEIRVNAAHTEHRPTLADRHKRQAESTAAVLFSRITALGPEYLRKVPSEEWLSESRTRRRYAS